VSARATAHPAISVVVPAYQARPLIDAALESLLTQELDEPYEVIVVDSGSDGCADHVELHYPRVRIVRSPQRLGAGAACNAGVEAALGEYVAFLPADCIASPDWLRKRLAKHREGYEAVGGAVVSGTPWHPVGGAGYYLEYSAVMPSSRLLAEQNPPHGLSYTRRLFERLGPFAVDTGAGEDTLFNRRCVEAGVAIGFDADVRISHRNPTRLTAYLQHQYEHGRSLARCAERDGGWSPSHPVRQPFVVALARIFVTYPVRRWIRALLRVGRRQPRRLLPFLVLTPLIWLGAWAASAGLFAEFRALRRLSRERERNCGPAPGMS
jgi:glycosyltransferase involved in cell wall biosynthesis